MTEDWSNPPRWAEKMLGWFCSEEHLDILLGDLYELYEYRYEEKGKFRAKLHYVKDAFDMLRPFARRKRKSILKTNNITMVKNYLKIGWRNMLRHKGYSAINVFGLALGLACCFILYRYVTDELSYDKYNEKKDRIYRVAFSTNDDGTASNANGSFGPAASMAAEFAEVEHFTRFRYLQRGTKILMKSGDDRFYENRFFFADSSVFDVFSFQAISGNLETALDQPNTMVLTRSTAEKYFPNEEAVGKIIRTDPYNDGQEVGFMVTAVIEDVPSNSHFHFDVLGSFHSQKENLTSWRGFWQVFSYVLLHENTDVATLQAGLEDFPEKIFGEGKAWYSLVLQPLTDIHLKSDLKSEIEPTSSMAKVYVFSAVGLLILVIACINFLTLSTAKSVRRAKEVGVRKTFGAHRSQLFSQFICEALLHGAIATVIAMGVAVLTLPMVNQLTRKSLTLVENGNVLEVVVLGVIAILVVAFMAGLYPALFLSSFKPIVALKSKVNGQGGMATVRKALVIFQFTISIALIVGSLVVREQMSLVRDKSISEKGNQIVVLPLNNDLRGNLQAFENQLDQVAGVEHYAGASRVPTKGSSTNCFKLTDEINGCAFIYSVGFGYPEVMNYELVAGRYFDKALSTDSEGAYIVTRAVVDQFQLGTPEEALGKKFGDEGYENARIIGVIEDFHVYSLRASLEPAYLYVAPKEKFNYMAINVATGDLNTTLSKIGDAWDGFSTEAPFDYFFLDEAFQRLHQDDMRTGKVVSILTLLAMIIAATGLFGLASFMTEQKSKEIGIRKVLGANLSTLLGLMSKSYFKLIAVAVVIGVPGSFWLMSTWLENFEYRISINPLIMILAVLMVVLVVAVSVGYQSIRAALANPVNSLRNE